MRRKILILMCVPTRFRRDTLSELSASGSVTHSPGTRVFACVWVCRGCPRDPLCELKLSFSRLRSCPARCDSRYATYWCCRTTRKWLHDPSGSGPRPSSLLLRGNMRTASPSHSPRRARAKALVPCQQPSDFIRLLTESREPCGSRSDADTTGLSRSTSTES